MRDKGRTNFLTATFAAFIGYPLFWRSLFQSDRAARHGMNWFSRMGWRVLLHEWKNFWFHDNRVKNGPTLEQFWGAPQDEREIPLRIRPEKPVSN